MLRVERIRKTFAGERARSQEPVVAVDTVTFDVPSGKLLTLLGPSGCGKTTVLRCIAGLDTPDDGRITIGDEITYCSDTGRNSSPGHRRLGMVFQSYAIWPHMTVFENVEFPLIAGRRSNRMRSAQIERRVNDMLAKVRLEELRDRPATDLSGGQQQRLALARALVMQPRLLLLDEPLSNLDARLRDEMRLEIKRLQVELGITALYVTHDQAEALSMSDLIGVMKQGAIEQIGTPREIYDRPNSRFVAKFVGDSNLLDGTVRGGCGKDTYLVETAPGCIRVRSRSEWKAGAAAVVSIRPEHFRMSVGTSGQDPNGWVGEVVSQSYLGGATDHMIDVSGVLMRVRSDASPSLSPGSRVNLEVPEDLCTLIPATADSR